MTKIAKKYGNKKTAKKALREKRQKSRDKKTAKKALRKNRKIICEKNAKMSENAQKNCKKGTKIKNFPKKLQKRH